MKIFNSSVLNNQKTLAVIVTFMCLSLPLTAQYFGDTQVGHPNRPEEGEKAGIDHKNQITKIGTLIQKDSCNDASSKDKEADCFRLDVEGDKKQYKLSDVSSKTLSKYTELTVRVTGTRNTPSVPHFLPALTNAGGVAAGLSSRGLATGVGAMLAATTRRREKHPKYKKLKESKKWVRTDDSNKDGKATFKPPYKKKQVVSIKNPEFKKLQSADKWNRIDDNNKDGKATFRKEIQRHRYLPYWGLFTFSSGVLRGGFGDKKRTVSIKNPRFKKLQSSKKWVRIDGQDKDDKATFAPPRNKQRTVPIYKDAQSKKTIRVSSIKPVTPQDITVKGKIRIMDCPSGCIVRLEGAHRTYSLGKNEKSNSGDSRNIKVQSIRRTRQEPNGDQEDTFTGTFKFDGIESYKLVPANGKPYKIKHVDASLDKLKRYNGHQVKVRGKANEDRDMKVQSIRRTKQEEDNENHENMNTYTGIVKSQPGKYEERFFLHRENKKPIRLSHVRTRQRKKLNHISGKRKVRIQGRTSRQDLFPHKIQVIKQKDNDNTFTGTFYIKGQENYKLDPEEGNPYTLHSLDKSLGELKRYHGRQVTVQGKTGARNKIGAKPDYLKGISNGDQIRVSGKLKKSQHNSLFSLQVHSIGKINKNKTYTGTFVVKPKKKDKAIRPLAKKKNKSQSSTHSKKIQKKDSKEKSNEKEDDKEYACMQVITRAKNPETGKVKTFATPCDVPEGWVSLKPEDDQNDQPSKNVIFKLIMEEKTYRLEQVDLGPRKYRKYHRKKVKVLGSSMPSTPESDPVLRVKKLSLLHKSGKRNTSSGNGNRLRRKRKKQKNKAGTIKNNPGSRLRKKKNGVEKEKSEPKSNKSRKKLKKLQKEKSKLNQKIKNQKRKMMREKRHTGGIGSAILMTQHKLNLLKAKKQRKEVKQKIQKLKKKE